MIDIPALESVIDQEMARHHVPGFALAIVEGAEIMYARGFGVASVEQPGVPVTPHTLFCCGSISKSLTAATVLRLVDRGLLDLDEPVTAYLSDLTFSRPEFAAGITLRRLLSHSSGLFGTAGNFGPRDLDTLAPFIRRTIPCLPFVAPPGLVYEYSSLGIDLAGYTAEVVDGRYFPEVVQQHLLDPLAMERTTYDRTVAMTYDVALPHLTAQDGTPRVQHRMFDYAAANPAGQAMASTRDLAYLLIMVMNDGGFRGHQVLPAELARAMRTPQISFRDVEGGGYGLGFFTLRYRGHPWIAHGGTLTPYQCEISFLPDQGIGLVLQCNVTNDFDPYAIRRLIFDQVLESTPPAVHPVRQAVGGRPEDLSVHADTYFSLAAGFATLTVEDDHLVLERQGERTPLFPIGDDRYADRDGTVVVGFVCGEPSPPHYFMLDEHVYERFEQTTPVELPLSTLQAYAGRYRFDDGDTATAWVEDDTLYLSLSWLEGRYRCLPLDETTFATDLGLIEFRRRPEGEVVLVWAGGVLAEQAVSFNTYDSLPT